MLEKFLALRGLRGDTGGGSSGGGTTEEWINDGNTHIWITLPEGRTSPMLGVGVEGTVTVDWGDGTAPYVITGTNTHVIAWTQNHTYANPGEYVITLNVDGQIGLTGNEGSYILRHSSASDDRNKTYNNAIKKVEIGSYVDIRESAFENCRLLTSVSIPNGVIGIGNSAFSNCHALKSIVIPNSVRTIGSKTFYNCHSLTSVVIPDSVLSIDSSVFYLCTSLTSVVIPDSVTSVGSFAFYMCGGLRYVDLTAFGANIPTLGNANAFNGIPDDCEILVDSDYVLEWVDDTNWSALSDYIVGVLI